LSQAEAQRVPDAWRVVRKVLRWLGITILGFCGVVSLLFAVAFLINLHDEDLAPQTRALLTPLANPYSPEDNIYLALAGLDAPIGATVIAVGEARLEAHNQRVDAYQRHPTAKLLQSFAYESEDPRRLVFKGDCGFIEPLNSSVWSAAFEHREDVDKLLADNRELYERYLALPDLHGYYETARPSLLPAYFGSPGNVHRLFLAVVALRLHSGIPSEQQRGLVDLERDVQLWHTVLTGQGSLMSSMLSAAYLQQDYLLLADVITDSNIRFPAGAKDAAAVVPLFPLDDWDLGKTMAAWFRDMAAGLRTEVASADRTGDTAGWLARAYDRLGDHFLKINATLNLDARETERHMLAAADPARLNRLRSDRSLLPEGQSVWTLWLSYNPLGKGLVAISTPVFEDYSLRAWDAAALQRLVRLSFEIRHQRIEPSTIPAFLRQHPEWSTHPADGRPFLWNPAKGELRVQTVGKQQPGRRFSIRVWQPAAAG
jgi:hypothetical protein